MTPRSNLTACLIATAAVAVAPTRAAAQVDPVPSFRKLVTGNGFGFQVFDVDANAVVQYLERPYRFMRPNPSNPDGEGIVRRNLVFDTYFGVRVGSDGQWLEGQQPDEAGYVEQTNVIRSAVRVGDVLTESFYVSPYGYEGNAMVMILRVTNTGTSATEVDGFALTNFHMGSAPSPDSPQANNESIAFHAASGSATETGPGGGVMVYQPFPAADASSCAADAYQRVQNGQDLVAQTSCEGDDRVNVMQASFGSLAPGASHSWAVAVLFDAGGSASAARADWDAFLAGDDPEALLQRILDEWEAWRTPVPPGMTADEVRIWRQGEAVLRMGQVLEPYTAERKNHGMVLASLPPGGWHSGWLRDAVYALVAYARTGHYAEAKAGLNFFLDADAGKYPDYFPGVDDYRLTTVRYFGNGEEEADYSGQPTRNIEIDGWGLFLWAARAYVDASGDRAWLDEVTAKGDTVYEAMRDGVAEPLWILREPNGMSIADASIWEVHWGSREHFAYTTAATARGLCDFAALARIRDELGDRDRYKQAAEEATSALRTSFTDQNDVIAGSVERLARGTDYHDGAVVEAITWDLIPPDDPIAIATMNDFSFLRTPAGGYKRVEGSFDQYDLDEWILIDLRASDAWRRIGNDEKAAELLDWVTAQGRVNYDLLPELYNTRSQSGTIGAYTGSIPMVGYGPGAYMMAILDRVGRLENTDCGTVDPDERPDAGPIDVPDAGAGNGDGDGGTGADGEGRTGFACVCASGRGGPGAGELVLLGLVCAALARRRRRRTARS